GRERVSVGDVRTTAAPRCGRGGVRSRAQRGAWGDARTGLSRMRITQDEERDEVKDELLDKAVQLVHTRRSGGLSTSQDVAGLVPVYYRHVAYEDIEARTPTDIYGAAVSHLRLAAERPQGTATVRVFTPTVDEHGWSADGHTVVEIVTDDMPFLVDSVTMALS